MTELEIYQKCLHLGMTPAGAAGCTANIMSESAGRPDNVEDRCPLSDAEYTRGVDDGSYADFEGDRYGYGLAQWTLPARKAALLQYAREHGVSISDADMQFQFLAREMRQDYAFVWRVLTSTKNPYEAGYEMCKRFERPQHIEESSAARGNKAVQIYERCKSAGETKMRYDKQKLIDWGYSQIGYHEKASNSQLDDFTANAGDQNWTKYAAYLDSLGDFYNGPKNGPFGLWCDIWYDYGMVHCYGREAAQYLLCQPDRSAGAGCRFSAEYYQAKGRFYRSGPETGDQIFFGTGWDNVTHTGLVVKVDKDNGIVTTIEGNTSDMVAERRYTIGDGKIFGYGRPRWDGEDAPAQVVTKLYSVQLPLLKDGSKGGYVQAAQTLLIALGYSCGGKKTLFGVEKADGDFGKATKDAVQKFQSAKGLEADGEIGGDTWAALLKG